MLCALVSYISHPGHIMETLLALARKLDSAASYCCRCGALPLTIGSSPMVSPRYAANNKDHNGGFILPETAAQLVGIFLITLQVS